MHTSKIYIGLLLIGFTIAATTTDEDTPLACLQCNPDATNDCLDLSKIEVTNCAGGETKCYTSNANGLITRGCFDGKSTPCDADKCKTCETNGCNKENICKTCDTTDSECSQSNVSDSKYNAICPSSETQCFMNVKDKKVERRCATDQDKCSDTTTCNLCTGINCNAGIFPTNRRQCFQCTGTTCDSAGSNKDNAKPCLNFVADDKCYAIGTSAETMTRGCTSDAEPKPCEESDNACVTCGDNNCNALAYKRDATMSCIKCNTDSNADCSTEHDVAKAEVCKGQLAYNQTESCYTYTKGSSVRRGCLFDDGKDECDDKDSCALCSDKNGCNNQKVDIKFTCIVCRSDLDPNCWNNAKKIDGKGCRTGDSSKEEGCFHGIWNDVAIRGCYIDADERMKVICEDNSNPQCRLCKDNNCNTGDSSGAGSIAISFSLLSLMLVTLWNLK